MASLGTWGNPTGMFGGFTTTPEAYQIRRLLKANATPSGRDESDAWKLVDPGVSRGEVRIEYEPDRYYALNGQRVENRCIPNTGEPLVIRYCYVAGEEFTELFRIRRTWGEPDFYAMAINGYTDDGYGKYVKQTLAKLSKEELRLLRNHLFALYGYVFQSADLSGYFGKQVWYLPKAEATTGGIESRLPAERRALLELVQQEERTR